MIFGIIRFVEFNAGVVFFIFNGFCMRSKKYVNEMMSLFVELSVFKLVPLIFCASFTQKEEFIE